MRGLENKRRRTPAWEDDTSMGEGLEISPGMWAERGLQGSVSYGAGRRT